MTSVDVHHRAVFDARQARRFYGRVSAALAAEFVTELNATVGRIAATPGAWPPHVHGTRICRLHRFPYHVVYIEYPLSVLILAVAHNRRRPTYWLRRLP